MNKTTINPWTWQDQFAFVQANEISHEKRMLICAGQTSNDENGNPLDGPLDVRLGGQEHTRRARSL